MKAPPIVRTVLEFSPKETRLCLQALRLAIDLVETRPPPYTIAERRRTYTAIRHLTMMARGLNGQGDNAPQA